jgi:hypothetical protein
LVAYVLLGRPNATEAPLGGHHSATKVGSVTSLTKKIHQKSNARLPEAGAICVNSPLAHRDMETSMRKHMNILSLIVIAAAAAAVWTLTQSRAVSQKFAGASAAGINVLDLTMKAGALPAQRFDAH